MPPQGMPTPKTSSCILRVIRIGFSVRIQRRASLRTALSAQPPPTQPIRIFPCASISAFDPGLAEEEPCVRTIVATANDCLPEESSAALAKKSMRQTIFYHRSGGYKRNTSAKRSVLSAHSQTLCGYDIRDIPTWLAFGVGLTPIASCQFKMEEVRG